MDRLTEKAHRILFERLKPGDVAVDATAGNGHDTLFLAQAVEPAGRVYAFDLQLPAIEQARQRLKLAGRENVQFLHRDHAEMASAIPAEDQGRIAAVMFNLGYLPGSDKTFITQASSTCRAISTALRLLKPSGVLTVLAYTGHPGGLEEATAVESLLQTLSNEEFAVECHLTDRPYSPRLFVAIRREKSAGG